MSIILTYPTPEELAHAAAERFLTLADESTRRRGRFAVALSGGSTPQGMYRKLATIEFAERVPWEHVHLFWSDERHVPRDHPESNYRMAVEALLRYAPIPPENIHPVDTTRPPEQAALEYERAIRAFFSPELPRFDLILLGMGHDGHTASLFPHTQALHSGERLVVANFVPALESWRVTFTPHLINLGRDVTFLVTGERKARRLRQVLFGPFQPEELPAQLIRPPRGRLCWMVDEAAALHIKAANASGE
ncbi:MAG: 6-phosphogluconolactonase [Anaerolineae bacterium]|nr:MAG: 6-phosphogluconolactonase [Anaerolineae bacterium]